MTLTEMSIDFLIGKMKHLFRLFQRGALCMKLAQQSIYFFRFNTRRHRPSLH